MKEERRLLPDPVPARQGDDVLVGEEEPAVAPLGKQLHKASGHGGHSQAAGEVSAAPPELHERAPGCLDDDAKLLMDESGLHTCHGSSLVPADAQEGASFDYEETGTGAVSGDKHSPSSVDFGNISALDEYGQHVEKIEEHNRDQGRAGGHVQALLHLDDDILFDKFSYCYDQMNYESPERRPYCFEEYEEHQLKELYERLASYRIRGYELSVDRKLAELDDANLKLQYPSSKLREEGYFQYYEESLEWYFDRELCQHDHFDDYQRLVLRNYAEYLDWDRYHSTLNTYDEDLAYVQYCEGLAKETKWIEDYLANSTFQWKRIETVANIQALEIAAGLPRVSPILVYNGFKDYICSFLFDYSHKGFDDLYFEIWKRVAKKKMNFDEALLDIHRENMFPLRSFEIKDEIENTPGRFPLKNNYDAHVACIDEMVSEDKACQLIKVAVKKMIRKPKYYLDYARQKLDIAKDIGLIPKD